MMSRELKLALILGFAAVMVVGVLISDHMSGARSARIEERTLQTPPLALIPPQNPTGGAYDALPNTAPNQFAQTLPDNAPEFVDETTGAEPPVEIAMGEPNSAVTAPEDDGRSSTLDSLRSDFLAWSAQQGLRFEEVLPRAALAETENRRTNRDDTPVVTTPLPNPNRAPSSDVTHTVREGETLWRIAEQYYGDGSLYTRIEEANKGRMGKGDALYVGARLIIPGATTKAHARQAAPRETEKKPAPSTKQPAARDRFHVVQKGETLGDIAREKLGSARRWPEIVRLNQSIIRDPDNVPAGVRLRLPEN